MAFSKKIREEVYKKTGGKCAYCGCDLPTRWHVDHVIPINRGYEKEFYRPDYMDIGTDNIDNLLPACPSCNINKSNLSVEDYRQSIIKSFYSYKDQPMFRNMIHYKVITYNPERFKFYFEQQGIIIKGLYEYEIIMHQFFLDAIIEKKKKYNCDWYDDEIKEKEEIIQYFKKLLT